jgi:hypothetical protein
MVGGYRDRSSPTEPCDALGRVSCEAGSLPDGRTRIISAAEMSRVAFGRWLVWKKATFDRENS